MRSESVHMLEFPQHGDERGHLVVVEGLKDIPFEIKRVFYIYGSDAERYLFDILFRSDINPRGKIIVFLSRRKIFHPRR